MMKKSPGKQQGGSPIVTIIILAVIGVAVFIGLQYVPQVMESGSIDKILDELETEHGETPFTTSAAITQRVANKLNINDMNDMMNHVTVKEVDGGYSVIVTYERELNLIYKKEPKVYDRTVTLMN
jgi:hypothetical protein